MKEFKHMGLFLIGTAVFFLLALGPAYAHNKVVVIPLSGGGGGESLKNVITVSSENGDYSDPVTALNAITDASGTNQYTIFIGPGVYTLTQAVAMKPWVSIYGAGRNSTILKISSTENAVMGADDAALADLTIEVNCSGQTNCTGMQNGSVAPLVRNVRFYLHSGSTMHGIYNIGSGAAPVFEHVSVELSASGNEATGISNWFSGTVNASDLQVVVNATAGTATGMSNNFGSVFNMEQVDIHVSGSSAATQVIGIENKDLNSELDIRQGRVTVTGLQDVDAVDNISAKSFTAQAVDFSATNDGTGGYTAQGIYAFQAPLTLLQSRVKVDGSVVNGIFLKEIDITLRNVSVNVNAANDAKAIWSLRGTLDATEIGLKSYAEDGAAYGLFQEGGASSFKGCNIESYSLNNSAWGLFDRESSVDMYRCEIHANSLLPGFGVHSAASSSVAERIS